jgi:hypothetical protein
MNIICGVSRHIKEQLSFHLHFPFALPVLVPEPFEVHPEGCLLEQSLLGQPQSELEQQEAVLLLRVALESKHSNVTCNSYILNRGSKYQDKIIICAYKQYKAFWA